jgi:uncharacterized protein (DUF433 family)
MKTFRLDPTVGDRSTAVVEEVDKLLREGRQVVVTVVDETKRYKDLRDGSIGRRELGSLRDLATALVEARIVAGLTQKQLGERLEVEEQQIQRWEANLYSGVGVERLQEVVDALGMDVKVTVDYAATRITVRPDQMDGAPCIRGLRIPVATVLDMVAEGMSESEIVAAYPDLEPADVRAVISRYRPQRKRIGISLSPATSSASTPTLGGFRRFPTTPMVHAAKGGQKGAKRPLSNHAHAWSC